MAEGLQLLSQSAAHYVDGVVYVDAEEAQGPNADSVIQNAVISVPLCKVVMLRNGGAMVLGRDLAEAFTLLFFLNRICAVQLEVRKTGRTPTQAPQSVWQVRQTTPILYVFRNGRFLPISDRISRPEMPG